jgi:hypothetical protein
MVGTVIPAARAVTILVFTMQNMLDTITIGLPIQHTITILTRTPIPHTMVGTLMLQLELTHGLTTPMPPLRFLTLLPFIQEEQAEQEVQEVQVVQEVQAEQAAQAAQAEQAVPEVREALVVQVVLAAREQPEKEAEQVAEVLFS